MTCQDEVHGYLAFASHLLHMEDPRTDEFARHSPRNQAILTQYVYRVFLTTIRPPHLRKGDSQGHHPPRAMVPQNPFTRGTYI